MTNDPMNTTAPDVAVLVVSWNTRDLLAECLQSIEDNSQGLIVQTLVVDNASSDGAAEMVRAQFPGVQLRAMKDNLGFVGGNNLAYQSLQAAPRFVLLLNPDARLQPGALAAMVLWMDSHPTAGACGPLTLNTDGTLQLSWTRFPTPWSEVRGRHDRRFGPGAPRVALTADALRRLPDAQSVDWVSGACLLARGQVLAEALHGILFDPDFQMYSEETDLCFRLRRAGYQTFFLPQAEVVHHYGKSSGQAQARTLRLLYRSKFLFMRKHYGPMSERLLKVGVALTAGAKWGVFALLGSLPTHRRHMLAVQRDRQRAVLSALTPSAPLPASTACA